MSVPVYIILSYFSFICLPINSNLKKKKKKKKKKTAIWKSILLLVIFRLVKKGSFISEISTCTYYLEFQPFGWK